MASLITKKELIHAQLGLIGAIILQVVVLLLNKELSLGPQYFIIGTEIGLAVLLFASLNAHTADSKKLQKLTAGGLLGFISFANLSSLILVLFSLIVGHANVSGEELLTASIAIFATNIIVYSLWYWEIDSPALTSTAWTKNDKDFQFTQQDLSAEYNNWKPQYADYLYLSVTNAVNFAPADTRPLSHTAKFLMASQSLISVFTLALVIARSVSILG